jgi:hypothetical protein
MIKPPVADLRIYDIGELTKIPLKLFLFRRKVTPFFIAGEPVRLDDISVLRP